MRAEGIVRQVLHDVESKIHRARLSAVTAAAVALIHGGEVGLAALGRAIGPRSYKHGIKRIDRLLGNDALAAELELFYAALARYVLRSMERPVILLDWTEAGAATCALTAAVPIEGRAITIHSVVVPLSKYATVTVEQEFLVTLRGFLNKDCRPILVGDAGFRAPWMKRVRAMGWDFVVRVRGRTLVQRVGESTWRHWKQLWHQVRRSPRILGTYLIVRQQRVEAQLVAFDQRARTRRRVGTRSRNARAMRARRANREPWFLATSLNMPAKQVVKLYAARMQIELTFRDLKSHRFGWGFEDARCRSTQRIAIQIMLVAIASLVTLLVGLAAEQDGLSRHFQANTIRSRRVISLVALGRAVLARYREQVRIVAVHDHLPFKGIR
jgi:hypothetical protein